MSPDKNGKNSKTFCILPWMHLALNSTGYLRLCCNSIPGKNILLSDEGKRIHISDVKNSDQLKNLKWLADVRKKMLSDQEVDICKRCYREEKSGMKSARQGWNSRFSHLSDELLESTDDSGNVEKFPFSYLDLRLGNLCNLKCRMCNPYSSRKWLEDWNSTSTLTQLPDDEVSRLKNVKWFEEEETWSTLSKLSSSAEEIYFTGGEPFLIHQQVRLMDFLIEQGASKNITLKYNTNLTVLPEKIVQRWPHFKKVKINVSLDAIGPLNEYIRHPTRWSDILQHLEQINELARENKNLQVAVHTTVQIYNINRLTDVIDFLEGYSHIPSVPYFNILNHPNILNIRCLTPEMKKVSGERIHSWLEKNRSSFDKKEDLDSLDKLSSLVNYMNQEDWSESLTQFGEFNDSLDRQRSEKLQKINPEIAALIP